VRLEHYSIDDLHAQSLNEFELDQDAKYYLNALYEASQANYIAGLKLLRLRRQHIEPWESATS
jgi:hypothetical protein